MGYFTGKVRNLFPSRCTPLFTGIRFAARHLHNKPISDGHTSDSVDSGAPAMTAQ